MNFFKSVISSDNKPSYSSTKSQIEEEDEKFSQNAGEEGRRINFRSFVYENPRSPSISSESNSRKGWNFGDLIQTYRRDLGSREFSTRLKKETAAFKEFARRSIESVLQGTADIISHGKELILSLDADSDSSRFEAQVNASVEEPEDVEEFEKWRLKFRLEEEEEIERLLNEYEDLDVFLEKYVHDDIDLETFWSRYFYCLRKQKQGEDAIGKFVKGAILRDEEDEFSWDVENATDVEKEQVNKVVEILHATQVENVRKLEKVKPIGDDDDALTSKTEDKVPLEQKSKLQELSKDSVLPSHLAMLVEEEDLDWDLLEDLGELEGNTMGRFGGDSTKRLDLHKSLSIAEADKDLSWNIVDDDDELTNP